MPVRNSHGSSSSIASLSSSLQTSNQVSAYERKLRQARRDLSHVNACIRLFGLKGDASEFPAHVDVSRLFKRGEIMTIAKTALADGSLDTRELAVRVIRAKGLDEADAVLRTSVAFRIVQALRLQVKRGTLADGGRRAGVRVWSLPG